MTEVWAWVVGIVVVLVFLLPWSILWVGSCVDYAPGYGESYCESGPVIGFPAATVIAVLSLLQILYCLYRIVRILIQRRRNLRAQKR
jgi:hypothetical protein